METFVFVLWAVAVIALCCDWRETLYAAARPSLYKETNQLLGEHPLWLAVHVYFAAVIAIVTAAAANLPGEIAVGLLAVVASVEVYYIVRNINNHIPILGEKL